MHLKIEKGMIGELLVHVILEIEGRFTVASPFFNMEERSFKKALILHCSILKLKSFGLQKSNQVISKKPSNSIISYRGINKYSKGRFKQTSQRS